MRISDWSSDVCSSDLHYRERDVTILVHSRSLVNKYVISILKTHRAVRQIEGSGLGIEDTMPILKEMSTLDLGPARRDIGQIALAFAQESEGVTIDENGRAHDCTQVNNPHIDRGLLLETNNERTDNKQL